MQMTRQQPDPIGCSKFPTRQEQSEALGISALAFQTLFRGETSDREMSAVFSGYTEVSLKRE